MAANLPKDQQDQKDYQDYLAYQHYLQAQKQSQNPQTIPDSADKAAHPAQTVVDPGTKAREDYFKQESQKPFLSKLKDVTLGDPSAPEQVKGFGDSLGPANMALPMDAAPAALGKLATYLGSSAKGRIGANTAVGAAQGAINNPNDILTGALKGGLTAFGLSGAGEAGSGLASKGADRLMQWATGMRKYNPGVGNQLVDMGVVGTKSMMSNQVEGKLAAEEEQLQDLVKDLQGSVNSKEIADAVSQKAQRFTLPSTGQASPFSQVELDKVRNLSGKLSEMGDLSAQDLLSLKRQGDYQGFTASGNPATSTESELGRAGANAARDALKKMDPGVADSLLAERALIKAKEALVKPETIHQGVGSGLFFGKLPGASLGGSLGAQVLQKGVAAPAGLFSNPAVVQKLTGQATQE